MEENFNNNQQPKMKEPKKQEPNLKTKKKKAKVAIITLSTVVVLFLGLQVYASVNGYGNVFFMIKNLITTGNPAGNQEIFSDKDITLSYKSIELAEGLKIQANRLEIKDGKTKIYLTVKSQNGELLPLKYEVTTKSNEGNETTTTTKITGTKPENTDNFEYEDILTLDYEVQENKTIVLKIKDTSEKELRTLEINLQTREITVKGEKDFEKISQIELRKYLDMFSELSNGDLKANALLYIAQRFQNNYEEFMSKEDFDTAMEKLSDRAFKNAIIKEFYGDKAEFENKKQKDTSLPEVQVLKGITAWEYDKEKDAYKPLTAGEDYHYGRCLKIEDVSFENDIYTVKFIYLLANNYDERDDKLEELPQYETTIKLKRDENNLYSKYQIVSIEEGTEVKNKVNVDVNENNEGNSNEKLDNNHDKHDYSVVEYSGTKGSDGTHTTLDGTHLEKCIVCGEERRVPHNFEKWFEIKNANGVVDAYTLWCKDCKCYIYTSDYNFVKNSGYPINKEQNTTNNTSTNNTTTNIDYEDKLFNKAKSITNSVSQNVDNENWKETYVGNISTNFKYPKNFDIYTYEHSVHVSGGIEGINNENIYIGIDIERLPVNDLEVEGDLDRIVQSKDNNGWTDWKPVKKYGAWNPLNGFLTGGGVRKTYARTKNGTAIFARFDIHTSKGVDVEHYKFIRNILENISSTGV